MSAKVIHRKYWAQREELRAGLRDAILAAMEDMGPHIRHVSFLSSTAGEAVATGEKR